MSAAPASRETLAQILDRVTAGVAAAVPGLDEAGARLLVAEAASRRGALRHLDRHLAAFPGALASGSADAPKAVIVLAGLLAAAGYRGIVVAACLACGRPGELPHRSGDGRLCRNCYRQRRQEPCRRCGRTRPVHARTDGGPLCSTCSAALQPARLCGTCGQDGQVAARRPDGSAVCESCYRPPERPCSRCGRLALTYAFLPEGPVCRSCSGPPPRRCGGCGLDRPVRLRAAGGQPDLCERCARRPPAICAACGQQGRCDTRDGPPVCMVCRTWPAHECRSCGQARPVMAWWPMGPVCGACCRQIRASPANCPLCGQHQVLLAAGPDGSRSCGPCAGHPPEFACAACSGTDTTPRRRPCDRCAMNQQLHATLADPVLGIPAQLQPVLAHFGSAGSPRSVAGWLTGMPGGTLLAALAATAHHRELTHALLDEQPQTPALHHVRDMLVQAGVLPPRDEYLERIEPWLGEVLAGRPAQHAALVRPYATWHVLRRARRRSRGTSTMSAAGWARGRILAALAFLAWLDDRGTTLGAATQADVDDWLHGATRYRYLLRDFLAWATARRLAGNVTVPGPAPVRADRAHQRRQPAGAAQPVPARPGHPARRPDRRSAPAALRPVRLTPDQAHRRRHRTARPRHVPAARYRPGPPPAPARRPRPRPARGRPRPPWPPPALPRPLARTARRTPDPDPQAPPARNRAPAGPQRRARRVGIRPAPSGAGQPARRPHPDRRQLGQPHPPRLDHLPRRTDKSRGCPPAAREVSLSG